MEKLEIFNPATKSEKRVAHLFLKQACWAESWLVQLPAPSFRLSALPVLWEHAEWELISSSPSLSHPAPLPCPTACGPTDFYSSPAVPIRSSANTAMLRFQVFPELALFPTGN